MRSRRPERAGLVRAAALLAAATALAACGQATTTAVPPAATSSPSESEPIPGLNAADTVAHDRWQSAALGDYRFTVDVRCFCPGSKPVEVTVRDGEVVSLEPAPPEFWSEVVVPVPDLFRLVGDLRGSADVVDVTYDSELGYPTTIAVDRITEAIDDEVSYVVTDFAPLS